MNPESILWIVFWVVVATALIVDLFILNKKHGALDFKSAAKMVCFWVSLALSFGALIYFVLGSQLALEYVTGYVVEYSLSIDNMFVFLMIFTYFAIPKDHQPKVLLYGILGAVILRFIFVFAGVALINAFWWTIYLFGAVLIAMAVKMMFEKEGSVNPENNIVYKLLKKFFPFKNDLQTDSFFIREKGILYATPMLAAVVVIEASDIIFAVDSVPAVLSISRDTFIVYSSNIFAIIGLRSLYFLLSNLAEKFKYLKYGVAVILLFVGAKMLMQHYYHVPTLISLGVIVLILTISIFISVTIKEKSRDI